MTDNIYKYAKRIDTITNKIQQILQTEINENNKISSRPFSSHKNIHTNHKTKINKNLAITTNNSNLNNINNNLSLIHI